MTRKSLELAFRRWIAGKTPANHLVKNLRIKDPTTYARHLADPGQLDHVVPLSLFDLSKSDQIRLAWSLDNVRRLSKDENKFRGASVASAYLDLLTRQPIDETEYRELLTMVKGKFCEAYPKITIKNS